MLSEELALIRQISLLPPLPVPASFIPTKICLEKKHPPEKKKKKAKQPKPNFWRVRTGEEEGGGKEAEEKYVELFAKIILNIIWRFFFLW